MLDLEALKNEALDAVAKADSKTLEELRIEYLSKKGKIQSLMAQMRELPPEEKPKFGQMVNDLKNAVSSAMDEKKAQLEEALMNVKLLSEKVDITLDAYTPKQGTLHPLTLVQKEIDRNWKVISTTSQKPIHRKDIRPETCRIHSMSIRPICSDRRPQPFRCVYWSSRRMICRSRSSARAKSIAVMMTMRPSPISLRNVKAWLSAEMFSKDAKIRFRPSYFPFTEPSFEVDMTCHICHGKGCPTCKGTGWIEILGSGMVHPNVLEMAGIDSKIYTGFAFGVGIERVAMLKYGITDIRDLYTNDVRFLDGFKR